MIVGVAFRSMCCCCVAALLVMAPSLESAESPGHQAVSASQTVEALRVAYANWRSAASCNGTYRYYKTLIANKADYADLSVAKAQVGNGSGVSASGKFAMDGVKWRFSRLYDQQLSINKQSVPHIPGGMTASNASLDEAYWGQFSVVYTPPQGEVGGTAQIGDLQRADNGQPNGAEMPTVSSIFSPNPIEPIARPAGGMPGEPFPLPSDDRYRVVSLEDNCVELSVSVDKPSAQTDSHTTIEYSVRWSYQYAFPVITRISLDYITVSPEPSLPERMSTVAYLDDFCEVDGFPVSRHITTITTGGLTYADKRAADLSLVTHWVSEDICNRRSTPDDFIITVPSGTVVAGFSTIFRNTKPLPISVAALKPDDLGFSIEEFSEADVNSSAVANDLQVMSAVVPKRAQSSFWLVYLNTVAILIVLVAIALKKSFLQK